MEIKNTADISVNKLNILIYGEPGAGKTRFTGTAQPRFKTLVGSAESGLLSIRGLGVDYVDIKNMDDLREVLEFIKLSNDAKKYQCFAIDSGTEIQQVCMESILREEKRDKAQIADWGTLNTRMVGVIRAFRDLSISFIMTALEESEGDKITGEVKVVPCFQGKIQKTISGYFDEVFYAGTQAGKDESGKDKIKHYILTRNNGKYMGKDRSGKLPLYVRPDFCEIYDTIFNNQPKE